MRTTREEERRLKEVAKDWGLSSYPGVEPLGSQENLLHEVCHAVALGMRLSGNVERRVTAYFSRVEERSKIVGLVLEAQALAIEHHALKMLGWQRCIRLRVIAEQAWKNGTSPSLMPKKDFFLLLQRFVRERETKALAVAAAGFMMRAARKKQKPGGKKE